MDGIEEALRRGCGRPVHCGDVAALRIAAPTDLEESLGSDEGETGDRSEG
jgi:hypothetical protein